MGCILIQASIWTEAVSRSARFPLLSLIKSHIIDFCQLGMDSFVECETEWPSGRFGIQLMAAFSGECHTISSYGSHPLISTVAYAQGYLDGLEGSYGKDPYDLMSLPNSSPGFGTSEEPSSHLGGYVPMCESSRFR
jgi:hypothetical protein